MIAEQQVIWECFLIRRDRDLEWLWQEEQAGAPLGHKFFGRVSRRRAGASND
jgi:hypothetical protein